MTGRRNSTIEITGLVYVSQSLPASGDDQPTRIQRCRLMCQNDSKCIHFTLFGPNFDAEPNFKGFCVLNYGPPLDSVRELAIPIGPNQNATGFGSGPRNCTVL